MLRAKYLLRNFRYNFNFPRTFLSNEYKLALDTRWSNDELHRHKFDKVSSALNLNIFVNKLTCNEDHRAELCEQLLQIRLKENATTMLESTSFAVIRHFIDTNAIDQLVSILCNRLEYGIFIDSFTGCFLMNHLLKTHNYYAAALVAVEHMIQDDFDNNLVASLSLKSCFEYFKELSKKTLVENTQETSASEQEKKIRVKFVRNLTISDFNNAEKSVLIGKALMEISKKCDQLLSSNINLIGLLLSCEYEKALDVLTSCGPNEFYNDILVYCMEFVKNDSLKNLKDTIQNHLRSNSRSESIEQAITTLIQNAVISCENNLIERQKQKFIEWNRTQADLLQHELQLNEKASRNENAQEVMSEIVRNKNYLWYFKSEDEIDLKIFSKKVTYAKRWFGKKKKPKVVDDSYIPPDIRKKHEL